MTSLLRTIVLGLLFALFAAVPVSAQKNAPLSMVSDQTRTLVVHSASADRLKQELTIRGVSFGTVPAQVYLETSMLTVLHWSDSEIVVTLPAAVADGSYLLTVAKGNRPADQDAFHFSIVTMPEPIPGPAGPAGPAGPQGEKGEKGDKGDAGDKGDTGPQGLKGDTGGQGPQGPQGGVGPIGPMGPQGPAGVSGHEIVQAVNPPTPQVVGGAGFLVGTAACPAGKRVVGGGHENLAGSFQLNFHASYPSDATTWRVVLRNPTATPLANMQVRVFAICAAVGQ